MQIPFPVQDEYPPYHYLSQVLAHCPTAGSTYMMLWKDRNLQDDMVVLEKKKVCDQYMTTMAKFKNDMRQLAREHVINYDESPDRFFIELTNWDEAQTHDSV